MGAAVLLKTLVIVAFAEGAMAMKTAIEPSAIAQRPTRQLPLFLMWLFLRFLPGGVRARTRLGTALLALDPGDTSTLADFRSVMGLLFQE